MTEFRVNNYITLQLEGQDTVIYISGNRFQQCKFLFLSIPIENSDISEGIESIDEAAENLDRSIEPKYNKYVKVSAREEFWAHCSNIQAFYENNYDTRILHSNLAFPLLKELYEAGDPIAIRVFREEIAQRFSSTHQNTILFLLENNYQLFLTPEELDIMYQNLLPNKQELVKNFILNKFVDHKTDNELRNRFFEQMRVLCSREELRKYQFVTINEKKYFVEKGGLMINGKENTIDSISQIEGLSKLKDLKRLRIHHSGITSTDGLEQLDMLEHLSLVVNKIESISGLGTLIKLKKLEVSSNQIEVISGLGTLKSLEELYLSNNKITEIKGLTSLKNVKKLILRSNVINEIKGLDNLLNLEVLDLKNNKISKIEGLDRLKGLQHLSLDRNQITEIKGLENLINLESLELGYNKISEMKGLSTLPNLKELSLDKNQIREMKGIERLTNLRYISLENNQLNKVHKIESPMRLRHVNLFNNKLMGTLNREFDGYEDVNKLIKKQ